MFGVLISYLLILMWVKKMEWQMQLVVGIMGKTLPKGAKKKRERACNVYFEPLCEEEK